MKKSIVKIYKSRWHLLVTFFTIIVPFLFLLFFSRFAHIALAKLFGDVFISLWRLIIAYVLAAVVAWICALLFWRGKAGTVALPLFDVFQSFPTFAALPLATFFWGASSFTVIFFLFLNILWPVFFSVLGSLKLLKHDWEQAAQVAGLRGFNYLRYFLLPVSAPGLITGSIIGLGEGWEALVATEIIVEAKTGLGSFFQAFSHNPTMSAVGILGLLILIFSVNKIIWLPLLEWSHQRMEE